MRYKLAMCMALLVEPKILLMDEPLGPLDPVSADELWIELNRHRNEGMTILLSSHQLPHEAWPDRYLIMEQGETQAVMRSPLHPYAQLLISSIPTPDPRRRWREDLSAAPLAEISAIVADRANRHRCLFADRCPHVMAKCRTHLPPPTRVDGEHQVACWLHEPARAGAETASALAH